MRQILTVLSLATIAMGCAGGTPQAMDQDSLARHIEQIAGSVQTSSNMVVFHYEGVGITCVSDAAHDRMRLVVPVARQDSVAAEQLEILLVANFHTTLDARYGISEGVIYAAFLHRLSTLTRSQLESAIRQVAALSRNFGSSYSSGELTFGAEPGVEI